MFQVQKTEEIHSVRFLILDQWAVLTWNWIGARRLMEKELIVEEEKEHLLLLHPFSSWWKHHMRATPYLDLDISRRGTKYYAPYNQNLDALFLVKSS